MSTKNTPYSKQSKHAFWRRAIAEVSSAEVDPAVGFGCKINQNSRIATAGSCFAQHIARKLVENNFNYYVTEPAHPLLPEDIAKSYNYGTFSARYGNIYTSLQLRQLIERAYDEFHPSEEYWPDDRGKWWVDPFRPNIQPKGFNSKEELIEDRRQHLAAVRLLFENLDVFVFTLGLTECWVSKLDGAAFPLCPGVAGGVFDSSKHVFRNLTVDDVLRDMREFFKFLRKVNPRSKVILTVSPVPLIATAGLHHVLTATTYSKSVLRVAAETLCREEKEVYYFPSYEMITGSFSRGRYFGPDCREVTEEGVGHVMRLFFRHAAGLDMAGLGAQSESSNQEGDQYMRRLEAIVDVICDEQLIDEHR